MSLLEATQEGKVGRLCAKSAERTPHGESFEAMTDGVLSLKRKLLRVRPRGVFATLGRSRWVKRPPCSVWSRSPRSGELTLSAIEATFTSAAGATMNVGERMDSGRSRCRPEVSRRERPVLAGAADSSRPTPVLRASSKLPDGPASSRRASRPGSRPSLPPGVGQRRSSASDSFAVVRRKGNPQAWAAS